MKLFLPWLIAFVEMLVIIYLVSSIIPKVNETYPEPVTQAVSETESSPSAKMVPKEAAKFVIGDQVTLLINTKLRDKPGGELIQTLGLSEVLELTEGPVVKDDSWWWKAKVVSTSESRMEQFGGLTGYIAEGSWLKKK
ncbi:MAG: hypothetical protein A3F33_01155 [Candidatus Woykebacteria bacterium RIFCSPHIGHO2_12_FULL_43_10]|uniref:SH3b domain-containing protein n=2 Tax=Candidatus Woykeibacteriota TaxID=1817899 RepID=A0A1G1WXW9_9BACT|nr:MAG: hypothetical protein A2802_00985 [Candidatus Woykebacteria bacterium RIFCSPHIGHO2_01_FULL_43_29]OGY29211.1 MAG: hypothetical protein A3F33_01155 [Candidatus Woykebacteria bacterium RIFCSPHIGHO2_12_FULL_43_10]OGY30025.1 MAG: hypothetical protein A3J50_03005 [Candidatus Woykebacteria bacterium RIFCSPHIGHO2_02_FULL_43_16b]OGY31987.1 MAG: hypothetical protein A3A61_01030 [Candidatus Woykebacteria bacterium RIFCSPLOWO2_01_FULL_43_14]